MAVHFSIHDVSPGTAHEVDLALEACHANGIRPALLVVPNFHGEWPLEKDSAYCARLRQLQQDGHEIFLHGFFHRSAATKPNGQSRATWLFRQKVVSGGEAEFSALDEREGRKRLEDGERILNDAGLAIDGFISPAWSNPSWLLRVLGERGYRYTEDHTRIYDPTRKRSHASVVLNYASRSPARLFSTVAYCRIAKHASLLVPARVAIHPADMKFVLLRNELNHLFAWAEGQVAPRAVDLLS